MGATDMAGAQHAIEASAQQQVQVTLKLLRSQEKVQISLHKGVRVGELRHAVQQKFGAPDNVKVMRFTKQRTYVGLEDDDAIKANVVLYLKNVDWLQDPHARPKKVTSRNAEAFIDRPLPRRTQKEPPVAGTGTELGLQAALLSAGLDLSAAEEVIKAQEEHSGFRGPRQKFRVVNPHVWVRAASTLESKPVGMAQRDSILSGHVSFGWLCLDSGSLEVANVKPGQPGFVLIDGRSVGYGVLLEAVSEQGKKRLESPEGELEPRNDSAKEGDSNTLQGDATIEGGSGQTKGGRSREADVGADVEARSAAAWLVLPGRADCEEAPMAPIEAPLQQPTPGGRPPEGIAGASRRSKEPLEEGLAKQLAGLAPGACRALLDLLVDDAGREKARHLLQLLAAKADPVPSTSSQVESPAPGVHAETAKESRVVQREVLLARFKEVQAKDPLRLCQVFDEGFRYGDWHQDSHRFRIRAPFTMLQGSLQPSVLQYLLDRAPFNAISHSAMVALRPKFGIAKERHKQGEPIEFVKADWHTAPDLPAEAEIFVPRHGRRGPARKAPDHILAFTEAFRQVNSKAWAAMVARLYDLPPPCGKEDLEGLVGLVADTVQRGRHFGAVELQHFVGEAFQGKKHLDGMTSMLHLAVSLGGVRRLHAESALNKGAPDVFEEIYEMRPGDVYLSSPSAFYHSVDYDSCSFDNAMVSLHMRFLFEPAWWLKKWANHARDLDSREVAAAIAETLVSQSFRLPSLAEVQEQESKLRQPVSSAGTFGKRPA